MVLIVPCLAPIVPWVHFWCPYGSPCSLLGSHGSLGSIGVFRVLIVLWVPLAPMLPCVLTWCSHGSLGSLHIYIAFCETFTLVLKVYRKKITAWFLHDDM